MISMASLKAAILMSLTMQARRRSEEQKLAEMAAMIMRQTKRR